MRSRWYLGIALALCLPTGLQAQRAEPGGGLWLGVGAGGGWTRATCPICIPDRDLGLAAALQVGGTLSSGVLVGAEAGGWLNRNAGEGNADEYMATLAAVGFFYPDPLGSFYLKGGLGFFTYRVSDPDEDDGLVANTVGIQAGVGYDFQLAGGIALSQHLTILATPTSSLKRGDTTISDEISFSLVQFGLRVASR